MTRLRCLHHHPPMHRYQKSHKNPHLTRHISTSNTRHRPAKIIRGLLRYNPSGMALELGRNPCRRMCGWGNSIGINFSLNVRGVTMIRPPASASVGSFALFFYSPLGSSFSASIQRKNAHGVGCDYLARRDPPFPSSSSPCTFLDIYSDVLLFRFVNLNMMRTPRVEAVSELKYSSNLT
jgi:hypothetical protein